MLRYVFILTLLTTSAFAQAPEGAAATSGNVKSPGGDATDVKVEQQTKAAPVAAHSGDDAYRMKITDLQGRVDELKEKIFRTKTRLAILKESILSTTIAGAEARLVHRNEMGSSFNLEKVIYSLDGTPIFSKVDADGDLGDQKELQIFDGPIVPGNHTVSVVMVYRGNGFGIFSYLRGYVFTLRSSHTFHAEEGKRIQVKIVGYEKGGISTDLKDRPDIRFENVLSNPGRGPQDRSVND
jgi:hypothetical protein